MGCFLDREKRKLENFRRAVSGVPSVGTEAHITYNNQTIKPPGELYCLVSLVMSLFLPTRQTVPGPSRMMQGNVSPVFSRKYRDIWLIEDGFSHTLLFCLYYDKRSPEANLILSISFYLHAIVGL